MNEMVDNTFWMDFTIADAFGVNAIKDTFNRAFKEWKSDYKIWQHYEAENNKLASVYNELWEKADQYACDTLKDEALEYFLEVTD